MQTGILKKIGILFEMTESTTNVDTARAELKEIELEISELKDELVVLRESKEGGKYFKISEKQVDENIKVSLEAKIKKQEKAIKKLQKEIDSVLDDEANLHNKIVKVKDEIHLSNEYMDTIHNRLVSIIELSTKEYYETVLKEEEEKAKNLNIHLEELEKKNRDALDSLNYLNQAMEEMNQKLEDEKSRLAETKNNLGSQNSYIDEELKDQDDKRMQELQRRISTLETRRLEIITDPAMIASEAKEFIMRDDRANALSKIQELVTIVRSKPYMDIPSSNELTAMLQEEEEAATNARDEFASLIDTKNYSSGDTEVIDERIKYLNSEISLLENKIKNAKEEITNIDNVQFKELTMHLQNTMEVYSQLQDELAEYKIIIETENDDKTPKRRAILSAAYDRKQKELEDVLNIIEHYKMDQKVLVNKAYLLETESIRQYESEISAHKQEIREMEFLLENVSKAKDVLAIENDKQKLKDLDAAVKNIKHRQKYGQTPSEIYDEIEISLGTMDMGASFKEKSFDDSIISKEESIADVLDEITSNTVMDELPVIDNVEISPVETKEEDGENGSEENTFVIGDYNEIHEEPEVVEIEEL